MSANFASKGSRRPSRLRLPFLRTVRARGVPPPALAYGLLGVLRPMLAGLFSVLTAARLWLSCR